ncbi:DUF2835 domain-containing protein [Colwelliaceae bacterium 6441]
MEYFFSLNMSSQDFLPYYQGKVLNIVVTSTSGQRVQFPAIHMRKFLTVNGVSGFFCLKTENNKFISLAKLA